MQHLTQSKFKHILQKGQVRIINHCQLMTLISICLLPRVPPKKISTLLSESEIGHKIQEMGENWESSSIVDFGFIRLHERTVTSSIIRVQNFVLPVELVHVCL